MTNPKLCKRLALAGPPGSRTISIGSESELEKASVRDATLLLSIADICKSEIKIGGLSNLWRDDLTLPRFPCLSDPGQLESKILVPRTESLREFMSNSGMDHYPSNRVRSVSFDSPRMQEDDEEEEEVDEGSTDVSSDVPMVSPLQTPRGRRVLRKPSARIVKTKVEIPVSPVSPRRSKTLQGPCPKNLTIKKIQRKKFSWKNYPELEHFLIANREEYLRHSALNYTVQQKHYNNRLTDRLLEIATEHGYYFDEKEFSFVTVRDRIRCYYKSYVQSAKKRGVLMGYAARKAGLLNEDDLEVEGEIVSP